MRNACVLQILAVLAAASATAAASQTLPASGGECVPVARMISGVRLYGNAATWWDQAAGRYQRGTRPRIGAVMVLRPIASMPLGHVAVVSQIVGPRILMVTHSNWSKFDGRAGRIERDVTMVDVSAPGDWSKVRVWDRDNNGLGATSYPVYGFIYGAPATGAERAVRAASPSPELSGSAPDIVGAVIDAVG